MRPKGATFWLLNGQIGWRTAHAETVSVSLRPGIQLAGNPCGPLALTSPDGSLGGLTLPQGMALDAEGALYLLGQEESWIKRFDASTQRFVRLPAVGSQGEEARQFDQPANIAIAGHNLYVADQGNRRVQVFALGSLALRHVWGPWDVDGRPVAADRSDAWEPADVTAHAGIVYILDQCYGRVYRHQPGTDSLQLVIAEPEARERWSRVALDRKSRIYLLDHEARHLRVYDHHGQSILKLTGQSFKALKSEGVPSEILEKLEGLSNREIVGKAEFVGILGETLGDHVAQYGSLVLKHAEVWVRDASDVRHRFDAPALRLDHRERFCLPAGLTRLCDRHLPAMPPAPEVPLGLCPPWSESGLVFDREGQLARIDPSEPLGPKPYADEGTWISDALDSQIYRCQWHRIELALADLPAGSQVEVSTYTAGKWQSPGAIQRLHDHLWDTRYTITGQMQPPPSENLGAKTLRPDPEKDSVVPPVADAASTNAEHEFLVQSREGQYLWLRLEFKGDGYTTPAVSAIRVHYPRDSYLNYLPAVYSADDESRWFLERFLSIFQTEWEDLERRIDDIAQYFDPDAVPAGPFLMYLARWLALPLEGEWDWEQKRRLLAAAPRLYPRRGTDDGLRDYLKIYLQNITGLSSEEQGEYPQIVEGFRERQHLMLSIERLAELEQGAPLWSPSVVGRLQLDVFARESEVRLVSTGDPERDVFHEYAHRFRVFMPASWVRTAEDERMVRRALDSEKPAHTRYDLCLVEPRFRVGLQSTVGLDSVVGAYPLAQLACGHDTDAPPSQLPRHRLGYDTILAGDPKRPGGLQLAPETRVGIDTTLT